ncbi:hypothetical protein FRACYDRAFT_174573 [Fragilariopsis cylindrus CCMP1102]|uniref:Methyltransferase FkbM domain-containing protein n=1 Tax=Fragilariopsis cylindrus CCMP1102 TaxID=635003 RepID=A0A1E7EN23_9STRA|nr:hypothetical protein FRACYDRAFT_174573 [Fragilariopsis cylindrus CCMP1102]|eukprot:OEU07338.1 hypothetical protein FRACYDRAFT_174573 [Fragilariopsis cylindrus CCMP1102]
MGGNIGMWTLEAAAANHQTLTLEPSRDNYERICETVNRNQFHDRIHLMTIAATSVPATFTLNVPRGNKGGTSVVAVEKSTTGTDTDSNGGIITIQGFPIDSLHLPLDRPVVMKVDVDRGTYGCARILEKCQHGTCGHGTEADDSLQQRGSAKMEESV